MLPSTKVSSILFWLWISSFNSNLVRPTQEKKDEKIIKKYAQPMEDSEESDDDDKSNVTYDENDIKEAYENVMENENRSENIMEEKVSKKNNDKKNA